MHRGFLGWVALATLWQAATAAAASAHHIRQRPDRGLQNGNWTFESGKIAPWVGVSHGSQGTDRARVKIVSPGYNSPYAASLGPAPRWGSGTMRATIKGDPNTNYTVTAMYKVVDAPSPDCTFSIGATDFNENRNNVQTEVAMSVGDWAPIAVVWPNFIDDYGTFGIDFRVNCPGKANSTVLIDDIALKATGTLQPSSCSGDTSVPNGDFEAGMAPWEVANGESQLLSVVSPGDDSDHALQASFEPNATSATWWNDVKGVCFNYDYTYSFAVNWVNYSPLPTTVPQAGACVLGVIAYNCAADDQFMDIWPVAEGWTPYTYNCTTQRDNVEFYFSVACGVAAPTHAWALQIDTVRLDYVGGPAPPPHNPGPTPTPTPIHELDKRRVDRLARPRWV